MDKLALHDAFAKLILTPAKEPRRRVPRTTRPVWGAPPTVTSLGRFIRHVTRGLRSISADPDLPERLRTKITALLGECDKRNVHVKEAQRPRRSMRQPRWKPPPEHRRYFNKMLRCGINRSDARAEVERLPRHQVPGA